MTDNVVTLDAVVEGRKTRGKRGGPGAGRSAPAGIGGIRALGYEHGTYYYLSPLTGQVVDLKPDQHTEANLLQLRRLDWWRGNYPKVSAQGSASFDVATARDVLIQACIAEGPYDPERIRGRGVWSDPAEGAIIHLGNRVVAGDRQWPPAEAPLAHIYEAGASWPDLLGTALDDAAARRLLDVFGMLGWADPFLGRLLAGWIVTAPVCGALRWRAHVWLTGEAGSGKSWVVENLVLALLGPIALAAEGETTEAGVRQTLASDARPVVADEAEGHKASGQARIQRMLALARSMSSAGQTKVIKGGSAHRAAAFSGAAAFLLSSVAVPLARQADETRFTVLELKPNGATPAEREERFKALKVAVRGLPRTVGPDLLARTLGGLPTLQANVELLATAIGKRAGMQRMGDQLGTLLAGWWSLAEGSLLTDGQADRIARDIPPWLVDAEAIQPDQERCLALLGSWTIQVEIDAGRRRITRSLGWLANRAAALSDGSDLSPGAAGNALRAYGMRIVADDDGGQHPRKVVAIANSHPVLDRIFATSDFADGYARALLRLEGARRSEIPIRFAPTVQQRAVLVPVAFFASDGPEPEGAGTENGTDG